MGRKSKAVENDLVELIIDKSNGGKNTIVYVTEEVNRYLEDNGLHVRFSRESIRRVIKTHEEEIEDAKRSIEAAKAMAQVLKDNPGTEIAEATIMHLSSLIAKDIRSMDSFSFENPLDAVDAAKKLADATVKLSRYRTEAIKTLDKAKNQLKEELKKEIQNNPDLLEKLYGILDRTKIEE